jgi:hypothetical protein
VLLVLAVETLTLGQDWAGVGAVKRPGKLGTGGTAARNARLVLRNRGAVRRQGRGVAAMPIGMGAVASRSEDR